MLNWNANSETNTDAPMPVSVETLDPITEGFFQATRIATSFGWRQASAIARGENVLTFDGGMKPVVSVVRQSIQLDAPTNDPTDWPLFIPADTLGNLADLIVMPGQSLLVESALAEELLRQRTVLIRATDLENVPGITRIAPSENVEIVTLKFENEEVVFVAGGALLLCEGVRPSFNDPLERGRDPYRVLTTAEADMVLSQEIMPAGSGGGSKDITSQRPAA